MVLGLKHIVAPVERAVSRLTKRCYRKQLQADNVSFFRVLVCGGDYQVYRHLRHLYSLIDSGSTSMENRDNGWDMHQNSSFWDSYWLVLRNYQPWVVAHFHRCLGLKEGDPFYRNPKTERTWLYSDMPDLEIPCGMVWDWLHAAAPRALEGACLLSAFSHRVLFAELTRRVPTNSKDGIGYFFASMSMAMIFRMGLSGLVEDFAKESHEWKGMYASWDLESRLFLLNVLACLDRKESRDYMYAWGPDLFPEASGMLDVARATEVHPARLVRQWYDQRGALGPDSLAIEGLV